LAAFSAPSTFFKFAEPLSTTWSSTRSASRQFFTFTVTVPPGGVFGLDFISAAAPRRSLLSLGVSAEI
jgi:hypothetical protein